MTSNVGASHLHWTPAARVLDDVSIEVEAGCFCVLLGPNGSGKTSLLRALARVLRPDAGSVTIDGEAIDDVATRDLGRRRAFVSQDQPADLELTVMDVALIGRTPHKGRLEPDRADDRTIATESLEQVELGHLHHRTVPTLSGGERQRTFIARALAQRAPVLILDEPTNHLDLRHQHKLLADLRSTATTVVASLHDPQLAMAYADQVVILDRGRMVASGRPTDVITADVLRQVWGVTAQVDADAAGTDRITITGIV